MSLKGSFQQQQHCWIICLLIALGLLDLSTSLESNRISEEASVNLKSPRDDIIAGNEVTLKCNVDGLPSPQIKWYRNKIRVYDQQHGYRLLKSRLRIASVSFKQHNGVYSCAAENVAGKAESADTYLLNVRGPNTAHLRDDLFSKTTVTLRSESVWIHCLFENAETVQWYRGIQTTEIVSNNTRLRTTVYGNGTLHISSVRRSDEGTYMCQGIGSDGVLQQFTAELSIAKISKLTEANLQPTWDTSKPKIIAKGGRFEVDCLKPNGLPTPTITWRNPSGVQILSGGRTSVVGTKLILENVDESHTSNYTCVAVNLAGTRDITLQVVVTVPPVIIEPPDDTNIREGHFAQLYCGYQGTRPPWTQVIWMLNDAPLDTSKYESHAVVVNHENGTLTIDRADVSMEGTYSCTINTELQARVTSVSVNVNVIKKLRFLPKPRSMVFELGSTESVPCRVVAETTPIITWVRLPNFMELPDGVTSDDDGVLMFTNIQKEAVGDYTCVATVTEEGTTSSVSVINATISIKVGVSPTIVSKPSNQTVKQGHSAIINCEAVGDPPPYIRWDKDGTVLQTNSSGHFIQLENNSLLIEAVESTDEANYGCMVGNVRGFKRVEMRLTVASNVSEDSLLPQDSTRLDYNTEREKFGIGITKTIVIAVCSSVAYLALVIGLIAYCSIRLMRKKQRLKITKNADLTPEQDVNCAPPLETDGLMTPVQEEIVVRPPLSNGNGYMMHERPMHPINGPIILEERSRATPSQRSYKSNTSSQSTKSNHIIRYDRNKLHNIGVLGNGMYGDVFLAKAPELSPSSSEQLVCVKCLTSRDELIQVEFRREVEMFHKLSHDGICKLLALCKETEPIYMVMEYCEWGDLKQFLLATSTTNGQELTIDPPNTSQKLSMCHQIATAMNYLSSRRFVHKDLASRNVLLEPNLNVKIASLGLSRDIYASEYVEARSGLLVPLRWTSPEAWLEDDYSTKSDVWAFGCFLYEVFSGAEIPYADETNEQVIAGYESGELEPSAGDDMPSSLRTIAYQCWSTSPRDRPDFSQIVTMFCGVNIDSRV